MRFARTALLATMVAFAASPAFAATEQECEAAIAQTQREAADSPTLGDNEGRGEELATMLAQAGEAGLQGNYDRCLELVRDARGSAGLAQ